MKPVREARGVAAIPPAETGDPALKRGPLVVVVADSSRARLFRMRAPAAPLEELDDLVNPLARLHEGDLVEDSSGRRGTRPTQAKRSAFGGQTAKRHRNEEFAAVVCERAERRLQKIPTGRLYLVAEPEFLGLLRRRMAPAIRRRISGALAKSVTAQPAGRIRAALPARL